MRIVLDGGRRFIAATITILLAHAAYAADWSELEPFQRTITRDRFDALVRDVYAPSGALAEYLADSENAIESIRPRSTRARHCFDWNLRRTPPP